MKRLRKMTWVLLAWTGLWAFWLVSYGSEANCSEQVGQYQGAKQSGCEAGTAIGVTMILVIGALIFLVLAAVWAMTRPRTT